MAENLPTVSILAPDMIQNNDMKNNFTYLQKVGHPPMLLLWISV